MPSKARVIAAALALAACSGGHERLRAAPMAAGDYEQTGLASWYGEELTGARTASGTPFDPSAITAAHRSLPLGSFVEVTALDSGRSILVLVNDRGPGRKDRLIDLSRGAAQQLGFGSRSVARVRVRAVTPTLADAIALRGGHAAGLRLPGAVQRVSSMDVAAPVRILTRDGRYVLQVASFSNEARARALAKVLDANVVSAGNLWRVRLGPYVGGAAAQRARDAVGLRGYGDAQIVPAD